MQGCRMAVLARCMLCLRCGRGEVVLGELVHSHLSYFSRSFMSCSISFRLRPFSIIFWAALYFSNAEFNFSKAISCDTLPAWVSSSRPFSTKILSSRSIQSFMYTGVRCCAMVSAKAKYCSTNKPSNFISSSFR